MTNKTKIILSCSAMFCVAVFWLFPWDRARMAVRRGVYKAKQEVKQERWLKERQERIEAFGIEREIRKLTGRRGVTGYVLPDGTQINPDFTILTVKYRNDVDRQKTVAAGEPIPEAEQQVVRDKVYAVLNRGLE